MHQILMRASALAVIAVALSACGGGGSSDSGSPSAGGTSNTSIALNDTGITWCTDGVSKNVECTAAKLGSWSDLNQDGEVGRDAQASKGLLTKIGAGKGGFDFTKIDGNGNSMSAGAAVWRCVLDNRTGLMWEVKLDDNGVQDKDRTYQWYNPNSGTNGGNAGFVNGGVNTNQLITDINAQKLCHHEDWRLPTRTELLTIVNYGVTTAAVDTTYFPTMQANTYWTSTTANDATKAWYVGFDGSTTKYHNKDNVNYAVLVRYN